MPTDALAAFRRHLASAPVRWAIAAIAAFVLAAATITYLVAWRANVLLSERTIEALYLQAGAIYARSRSDPSSDLKAIVADLSRAPGHGAYALVDTNGKVLAGNLDPAPDWIATRAVGTFRLPPLPDAGADSASRLGIAVVVTLEVSENDHRVMRRLVVGRDTDDQLAFTDDIRRLLLASLGTLAVIGLGGGLLASRALLGRIDAVSATSRQIMAGDLSRRIAIDGSGDEFDRLAASLNAMLARTEELTEALREVSGNIAHDLKTPLNRLRNSAEAALRDPAGAPAYRAGLARVIEEADDLIKTFNALLMIARLEGGTRAEELDDIDVTSVVRDVAELYEPVAEDAGLTLVFESPGTAPMRANRQLVGQAVANLIDNAIKYGRPAGDGQPGRIHVAVTRIGDSVEIAVADNGAGIPAADRARVFDRFVRLEKSRSAPGSGLGLSLVAAVARLHDGSVRLEDNAPGLRVVLRLPVRKA